MGREGEAAAASAALARSRKRKRAEEDSDSSSEQSHPSHTTSSDDSSQSSSSSSEVTDLEVVAERILRKGKRRRRRKKTDKVKLFLVCLSHCIFNHIQGMFQIYVSDLEKVIAATARAVTSSMSKMRAKSRKRRNRRKWKRKNIRYSRASPSVIGGSDDQDFARDSDGAPPRKRARRRRRSAASSSRATQSRHGEEMGTDRDVRAAPKGRSGREEEEEEEEMAIAKKDLHSQHQTRQRRITELTRLMVSNQNLIEESLKQVSYSIFAMRFSSVYLSSSQEWETDVMPTLEAEILLEIDVANNYHDWVENTLESVKRRVAFAERWDQEGVQYLGRFCGSLDTVLRGFGDDDKVWVFHFNYSEHEERGLLKSGNWEIFRNLREHDVLEEGEVAWPPRGGTSRFVLVC